MDAIGKVSYCRDRSRGLIIAELAQRSYKYSEEPFKLVSGGMSHEYVNCKATLVQPVVLTHIGAEIARTLLSNITAVGGLTMGADPLAIATSMQSPMSASRTVRWFSVRKEAKDHGTKKLIEGDLIEEDTVCILDDVATTGGSTIKAIKACKEAGIRIGQVIVLVDREEGGLMNIVHELNSHVDNFTPVMSITKLSEIRRYAQNRQALEDGAFV